MKIRHLPASQSPNIQSFLDFSRRMLNAERQTCVKACSWDVSEVVPNKPLPQWEIFAAEESEGQLVGLLALDPQRFRSSIKARVYPANCCIKRAVMLKNIITLSCRSSFYWLPCRSF